MFKRLGTLVPFLVAFIFSVPAFAQIEEIIVTAQKREESVQDVPITVNVLTGDQLDQFNITRSDDLVGAFANIGMNRTSSNNTGFSIRGVGTDNVHLSGQQSVGVYIDGVSMVSPFVGAIGVFDIERVEVLRGPQNTLYGRNTTGGAVIWHTRQANPGDGSNGYGRVRIGNGGAARLEGAVGFDLSDQFAARVSLMNDNFDGIWTNVVDGSDTGGQHDNWGGRLNLVWDNGDSSRVELTYSHGEVDAEDLTGRMRGNRLADGSIDPNKDNLIADQDTGTSDRYVRVTAADVAAQPFLQDQFDRGTGMVIVNPTPGPFNRLINYSTDFGFTYQDPEHRNVAEWDGARLNIEHSFGNLEFTSLTSYDKTQTQDTNGLDLTGFVPNRAGDWEVWQQDFRLTSTSDGPVNWLVGLFFTDSSSTEDTWVMNTGAAGGRGVTPGIDIDSSYTAKSAYGQIEWEVSDGLTLTGGLRFTDDKLSAADGGWVRVVCGFTPSGVGGRVQDRSFRAAGCPGLTPGQLGPTIVDSPEQELSEWGWKIGGDYQFGDSSMVFASVSRGFKGGSYDNRVLSTGDLPVGPEFLTAYEIGYKGDFLDNTLQLNTSVYFYDWEGLQLFENIGGNPFLNNIPGTELKGLEIEVKWAPTEQWFFQGSLGSVDSEITETPPPEITEAQVGKEVTNTPDFTANLTGTYTIPVGNNELSLSLNYRYVSSMWFSFDQTTAFDETSAYSFLNARADYTFGQDGQYSASLWANNLTEEFTCTGVTPGPGPGQNNFGCNVGHYGEALWGVTFQAKFGDN